MRATVVLSGIPQFVTLSDLAYHLDKTFDTDEIETFRVRNLPYIKNTKKRQIALDFRSSYDAIYAQNQLDGKPYTLPDGVIKVLRAKVTNNKELVAERSPTPSRLLRRRVHKVSTSSSIDDDLPVSKMSTDQLRKEERKMDAQLQVLEKKKQVMLSEHELHLEKKRLEREIKELEFKESSPKKRSRSSSSDSEREIKKKTRKRDRKLSSISIHRKSSSCDVKDSSIYDIEEQSSKRPKLEKRSHEKHFEEHHPKSLHEREKSFGDFYSRTSTKNHQLRSPPESPDDLYPRSSRDRSSGDRYSMTTRERSPRDHYRRSSCERSPGDHYSRSHDSYSWDHHVRPRDRSRSREGYCSTSTKILVHRQSPPWFDHRHRYEGTKPIQYPKRKAIEYRPNPSDTYKYSHVYNPETRQKVRYKESIIVNMERRNEAMKARVTEAFKLKKENIKKKEELDTKKKEAIKDILLENEKLFNDLCMEFKVSDADKKRVLKNLFDHVRGRIDKLLVTGARSVSNLVMRYRCEHKTVDTDLLTKLFTEMASTKNSSTELAPTSSNTDPIWNIVDAVLQEFELDSINEDVNLKVELPDDEEREVTNITINLKPISSEKMKSIKSQDSADDGGYYVNITIDPTRGQKYFITIKIILKNMRVHILKYTDYVEYKTFVYVIRCILEKQITKILQGQTETIRAKALYDLYRKHYPVEGDHDFVLQVMYDIWKGKYNDKEGPEKEPGIVKQEMDISKAAKSESDKDVSSDKKVPIKLEIDSEEPSEAVKKNQNQATTMSTSIAQEGLEKGPDVVKQEMDISKATKLASDKGVSSDKKVPVKLEIDNEASEAVKKNQDQATTMSTSIAQEITKSTPDKDVSKDQDFPVQIEIEHEVISEPSIKNNKDKAISGNEVCDKSTPPTRTTLVEMEKVSNVESNCTSGNVPLTVTEKSSKICNKGDGEKGTEKSTTNVKFELVDDVDINSANGNVPSTVSKKTSEIRKKGDEKATEKSTTNVKIELVDNVDSNCASSNVPSTVSEKNSLIRKNSDEKGIEKSTNNFKIELVDNVDLNRTSGNVPSAVSEKSCIVSKKGDEKGTETSSTNIKIELVDIVDSNSTSGNVPSTVSEKSSEVSKKGDGSTGKSTSNVKIEIVGNVDSNSTSGNVPSTVSEKISEVSKKGDQKGTGKSNSNVKVELVGNVDSNSISGNVPLTVSEKSSEVSKKVYGKSTGKSTSNVKIELIGNVDSNSTNGNVPSTVSKKLTEVSKKGDEKGTGKSTSNVKVKLVSNVESNSTSGNVPSTVTKETTKNNEEGDKKGTEKSSNNVKTEQVDNAGSNINSNSAQSTIVSENSSTIPKKLDQKSNDNSTTNVKTELVNEGTNNPGDTLQSKDVSKDTDTINSTISIAQGAIKAEATVLPGDKDIKTEEAIQDKDDDDVIFVENSPDVNELPKQDTKSETRAAVINPTNEDDVKLVEADVEVIDLSDTEDTPDITTKSAEIITKTEKPADTPEHNVSKEDEVFHINLSGDEDECQSAADDQVNIDVSVDESLNNQPKNESTVTKNDALQRTQSGNNLGFIAEEIICLSDNEVDCVEVTDDESPDVKTMSEPLVNSSQTSLQNNISTTTEGSEPITDEKSTIIGNQIDLTDYDDNASVDTVILDDIIEVDAVVDVETKSNVDVITETNKSNLTEQIGGKVGDEVPKISSLSVEISNISSNSGENIGNQVVVSGNKTDNIKEATKSSGTTNELVAEKLTEEISKTCAERNSDFNDENDEESVEVIGKYLLQSYQSESYSH